MLFIGSLKLDNWLIMAPMAGVTDLPFRLISKRFGAGMVMSEMVSAAGLKLGSSRTANYLKSDPAERPLAVQIFGSRPEIMAEAAASVVESGADLVDINMGCPVKKVVKTGAGAALLRDMKKAEEIIKAVRKACSVPLTLKIRAGWSVKEIVARDFSMMAEACGVDAVTIHARFAAQGFSGSAEWGIIEDVKKILKIPLIGNGDVFKPRDAFEMKRLTGCNGVMIGRGALGNPWIFKQILDIERGLEPADPLLKERRAIIIDHFRLLSSYTGENRAAKKMRGLLIWYTRGLPHSTRFRGAISRIKDAGSMISVLDDYFSLLEERGL